MHNIKHLSLTLAYYLCIAVKYALLVVVKPASAVFATLESTLSEWEPSKPLHKSDPDDDIDYDKHLGI